VKYVNDAQSILFLILGIVLLVVLVKTFLLDPRKKRPGGDA
jgi:hypothetical protein